jgi:hypothetical protein
MALSGARDVTAAFTQGGKMLLVDGRGNLWSYDPSVTTDANGDPIVAPPTIDEVGLAPGRDRLVVLSGTDVWSYSLNQGEWHKGASTSSIAAATPGNPWSTNYNPGAPEVLATEKAA